MTAYTGTITETQVINSGSSNLWVPSVGDSGDSSSDSSAMSVEFFYNEEFPETTFEGIFEGSIELVEASSGPGTLEPGEYAIGDYDNLGRNALYVRLSDDSDPDDSAADELTLEQNAHYNLLQFIKESLVLNDWVVLRHDLSTSVHELILVGEGYGGTEEIYIGFQTIQDETKDYYNLVIAGMKGYVAGNTFDTQPGIKIVTTPAHNISIAYWLSVNAARINGVLKVGTPVYEHFGVGNFLPFAPPNQYPQPMFLAGMFSGKSTQRFSNTTQTFPWKIGTTLIFFIHKNDGNWYHYGSSSPNNISSIRPLESTVRDADGTYVPVPIYIRDAGQNIYGELDGIYHITGFNNASENTAVIDGDNYVILQDVYRTGFGDYIALKLV